MATKPTEQQPEQSPSEPEPDPTVKDDFVPDDTKKEPRRCSGSCSRRSSVAPLARSRPLSGRGF